MVTSDPVPNIDNNEDEILKIFFDETFVPQAFVDILLTNAADKDMNQVQSISSSLLGRLDYYTKNITKELESTIRKMENLSETLPGMWNVSVDGSVKNDAYDTSSNVIGGSSKLEYYLDTLGGAVRALESDMTKIDHQLDEINLANKDSENPVAKLENLKKIKERLLKVSQNFNTLRVLLEISVGTRTKESAGKQLHLSLSDFKISLKTLEETILLSLNEQSDKKEILDTNQELLKKVELFVGLKPLFKGLDKFYPIYSDFSAKIEKSAQDFLNSKGAEEELGI